MVYWNKSVLQIEMNVGKTILFIRWYAIDYDKMARFSNQLSFDPSACHCVAVKLQKQNTR